MHITTYKCRQTIAEVQLSYRVNQDTRQTCERKIYCQAKKVKMQTTASSNKLGCLGENIFQSGPGSLFETVIFFFFFASNTQPSISIMIFFLMPHIDLSKFKAESRNKCFHVEGDPPISPRLGGGRSVAGGLVAGGDGDSG